MIKSYLFCLLASAVLCGIVSLLAAGSRTEKQVRAVCGLISVLVVLSPVVSLQKSCAALPEAEVSSQFGQETTSFAVNAAQKNIESYINELLHEKFGISAREVCIVIEQDAQGAVVQSAEVRIEAAGCDVGEVREYLRTALGGNIRVTEGRA